MSKLQTKDTSTDTYKPGPLDTVRQVYGQSMKLWRRTVGRVVDWPPAAGHFVLGNYDSAVAVCTLSSTALIDQLSTKYAAIIGRVYTPNLGLEKMIRNVVCNPRLRYLVICGKESPVFKVGEAILMLQANGLDEQGCIIGATAQQAELPNLPRETLATFWEQIELVPMIDETSPRVIDRTLKELFERQTPPYQPADGITRANLHHEGEAPVQMPAQRRTWLDLDPLGYFIVSLDREQGEISVERYTKDKKLTHIIRGRAADMIYHTVINEQLLSQFDHAAYLGAELAKAETALYNGLFYEQDRKLHINPSQPTNDLD
jgi:tetrahydromethanopterin S-methyltransferase subunit A